MISYLSITSTADPFTHSTLRPDSTISYLYYQRPPLQRESPDGAVLIDDYLNLLKASGWKRTHIIQVPLSSERFQAHVVSAMQKKRILGVTSRYLIMAKKA